MPLTFPQGAPNLQVMPDAGPSSQTADRAAQAALRESEERFRTIFDSASDGILIANVSNRRVLQGNATIASMLGYTMEEVGALTLDDLHPSEDTGRVLEAYWDRARRQKVLCEGMRVLRKDGETLYTDASFAPALIGSVSCVVGIFRDTTERRRAEQERTSHIHFLESLARVDRAIKQESEVEQMLWSITGTVFSLFDCDRAWLLYPCDPEAPSFRVPVEVTRPEYPGAKIFDVDVPMTPSQADNMREALESSGPVTYVDGTDRPIATAKMFGVQSQMFVAVYPKLGKPWVFGMHQCSYPRVWTTEEEKLFTEIGRRISDGLSSLLFLRELRENEGRFRATFEQAAVGIAHIAPNGQWLRANTRLCDIVGYSREELLSRTFQDITHSEDVDAGVESVRQLLARESQTHSMERRLLRKDGSVVWINQTDSLVRDATGEPAYVISVIEDIEKRRKAEEEKHHLQAQLLHAQKMESVGRLAGGVAHDFNNMLSVILGQSELALRRPGLPEPLRHDLEEVQKAGQRAADLTRQLLAFARRQAASPKVLDLNDTVGGMISMLRRLIGEAIELAWVPSATLWRVKMDPGQIDQILANLCVNARDACAGRGKIAIETSNVVFDRSYCDVHAGFLPGEYVQLVVSDNGSGMEPHVLANLFEPFFTTKGLGQGTGLGLSTVYGIVKQNQGFINVYSEPGVGTTFRIYLLRHVCTSDDVVPEHRPEKVRGGAETVLLVEDESSLLTMTATMLETLGYHVLAAGTPAQAIALAQGHPGDIDLLVTDVVMPGMSGRDLCQRLVALRPSLRQLFMSGYTANIIADHGILEEGVCFLQKPFSLHALSVKVREALGTE